LLSVSLHFTSSSPQLWYFLCPQACVRFPWPRFASLLLAFARIWPSIHTRYISYTAPLHIAFHRSISPVQHRTSYQNLLCCHVQVASSIRHNPYTHLYCCLLATSDMCGCSYMFILWLACYGQHYCLAASPLLPIFSCICFFFQITPSLPVFFCQLGGGEKCAVLVPQCLNTISNKVLEHRFNRLKAMVCSLTLRLRVISVDER